MHAVFRLLEGDAGWRLEHVVGHFDAVFQVRILFGDLFADLGVAVVEGRQAVHELGTRVAGGFHQVGVDLIRQQLLDALGPGFHRFAHRYPDIGVNEVDAFDRFFRIFGEGDACAAFLTVFFAARHQIVQRPQRFRRADAHVHAEFGADQQQRVAHVVARVAQVGVADFMDRLVGVLTHGQHVGDHLGRVIFIGQAVEHRHAGELGQLFDDFLFEATVLNGVVHAPEHAGGVFHALFMADLRRVRVDVGDVGALVIGRHFEGATGAGRSFLEDQGDVVALQMLLLGASVFRAFQIAGQVEQVTQLTWGVVFQAEQVTVVNVKSHDGSPWVSVIPLAALDKSRRRLKD